MRNIQEDWDRYLVELQSNLRVPVQVLSYAVTRSGVHRFFTTRLHKQSMTDGDCSFCIHVLVKYKNVSMLELKTEH